MVEACAELARVFRAEVHELMHTMAKVIVEVGVEIVGVPALAKDPGRVEAGGIIERSQGVQAPGPCGCDAYDGRAPRREASVVERVAVDVGAVLNRVAGIVRGVVKGAAGLARHIPEVHGAEDGVQVDLSRAEGVHVVGAMSGVRAVPVMRPLWRAHCGPAESAPNMQRENEGSPRAFRAPSRASWSRDRSRTSQGGS